MLRKTLSIAAIAGVLAASTPPASAQLLQFGQQEAQMSCLPNLMVRALQAAQSLLNVTQAAQQAGITGRILTDGLQLCQIGGVYAWVFNEIGADGATRRRVINARTGQPIPGA